MPTRVESIEVIVNDPATFDQVAFARAANATIAVARDCALKDLVVISSNAHADKVRPGKAAISQCYIVAVEHAGGPIHNRQRAGMPHLEPANHNVVSENV